MKIGKLSICMISMYYPPFFSGPDLQSHKVNKRINDFNMEVFVLTRNLGVNRPVIDNVKIFRLPAKIKLKQSSKLGMCAWVLSVISFLILNREKYNIVHLLSGHTYSAIFAFIAGFILKKPVIVKNSLAKGAFRVNTLKKRINEVIFKKYAYVVAISSETRNEFLKLGFDKDRIIFISNGVELDIFSPVQSIEKKRLRKKLLLEEHRTYGIYTGFLNERKDISLLVMSVEHVVEKIDNFHLLLVGRFSSTRFEKHILDILRKKNLSQFVTILGERENIDELLKAADLFLFPSKREGLPNALLEAMACGLPSIAFSIGGVKDIIVDSYNGVLLEEHWREPQKFAEKITYLLQADEKLRNISQNAVSTIREKYNISETAEKYKNLYNFINGSNNES